MSQSNESIDELLNVWKALKEIKLLKRFNRGKKDFNNTIKPFRNTEK